jgi:hypothetical protein
MERAHIEIEQPQKRGDHDKDQLEGVCHFELAEGLWIGESYSAGQEIVEQGIKIHDEARPIPNRLRSSLNQE